VDLIGSAILTFIRYKQTDKQIIYRYRFELHLDNLLKKKLMKTVNIENKYLSIVMNRKLTINVKKKRTNVNFFV